MDAGFGVEEDSWGIAVAAYNTRVTGVFEASRLPGHPFNEMFYVLMWGLSSWWYNFSSALMSVLLFFFSFKTLAFFQSKHSFWVALAIVFVPVVYINSTCTVEYLWSVAFISGAFYFFLRGAWIPGLILFSMSVGCRLTNVVFALPFLYYFREAFFSMTLKRITGLMGMFALLCFLWYSPVIAVYGPGFFTYSDQFPYPSLPKVLYKASLGVWGVLGIVALCLYVILVFRNGLSVFLQNKLVRMTLLIVLLFTLLYIMLPQKSAYWIPVVPFVLFAIAETLSEKNLKIVLSLFLLSPFLLGINLTDKNRGSDYSDFALKTVVKGQEVFLDPIKGLVQSDYSKRKKKIEYVKKVMDFLALRKDPTIVIGGWWYNQLLISNLDKKLPEFVELKFYVDEQDLIKWHQSGAGIYFLEEQDLYNDLNSGISSTGRFAEEIKF